MSQYEIKHHAFTTTIIEILSRHFGDDAITVFENSELLGYLNHKTKSANRGSKSRGAFANHYALYVVIEDYISKGFFDNTANIVISILLDIAIINMTKITIYII